LRTATTAAIRSHRHARTSGQLHRLPADAEIGAGAVAHNARSAVVLRQQRREVRKVVLHARRHAGLESELARRIGVDQIVALRIDHISVPAFASGRANMVEGRPHIDVDDHDAEGASVRLVQRAGDAQERDMGNPDAAVAPAQIDLGDISLAGAQFDGLGQELTIALARQVRVRRDPDGAARPGAVDPHDLPPAVVETDDAKFAVARLGGELRHVAGGHAGAPDGLAGAADRIDTAREPGADDPLDRDRRAETDHVGARGMYAGLELGREHPRSGIDPIQSARQRKRLDVAIGEIADGCCGEQHQHDHRQRQTRR
jgi:hypothetical protein